MSDSPPRRPEHFQPESPPPMPMDKKLATFAKVFWQDMAQVQMQRALDIANDACAALAKQNGLVFTPLALSQVHQTLVK